MTEAGVRIDLLAGMRISTKQGDLLSVSNQRRALLAALVLADRPVSRDELHLAIGVSRRTLSSMLTRIATDDFGLPHQFHRTVGSRRRLIELDHQTVATDIADLRHLLDTDEDSEQRFRQVLASGVLSNVGDLGLVGGNPLSEELLQGLASLKAEAATQLAWFDLSQAGDGPPLTADHPIETADPSVLWLARLDHLSRRHGRAEARRVLAEMATDLSPIATGYGMIPASSLATAIIDTADIARPSTSPPALVSHPLTRSTTEHLSSGANRIVAIHYPDLCADDIQPLVDDLRRTRPASLGQWASTDSTALGTVSQLLRPAVAAQVRSGLGGVSARLLDAIEAIDDRRALEPRSSRRLFGQDSADLLIRWAGAHRPLLLIGRVKADGADLDRELTALLRLIDDLQLVIVHAQHRQDNVASSLQDFRLQRLDEPRTGPSPLASPKPIEREARAGAGAVRPQPLEQLLAVVAMATTPDGRVHHPLADRLLDSVGTHFLAADVLAFATEEGLVASMSDPGEDIVDRSLTSGLSAPDRRFLADSAIRWLVRHCPRSRLELTILEMLITVPEQQSLIPGVSAALIDGAELLASQGDLNTAIAALDLALSLVVSPDERSLILSGRGDYHRDRGDWDLAYQDYQQATELLANDPGHLAKLSDLALRLARLTWDPVRGLEVDALLQDCQRLLPPNEVVLAARVDLCLSGGSFQDGIAGTTRIPASRIRSALAAALTSVNPQNRAWGLIHARKGLFGVAPVAESLGWAEAIIDSAGGDVALLAHGHQALFVDHVRFGSWEAAAQALSELQRLARTPISAEQQYSAIVAQTCWDMANGHFNRAADGLASEERFRSMLAGSTFDQITLGHTVWLTRAAGNDTELESLASAAVDAATNEPGGEIWAAGTALLATDLGRPEEAVALLDSFARRHGGFDQLTPGAHRLPVLAIAAHVAAHAAEATSPGFETDVLETILAALSAAQERIVLIGWPTLILGPVDRYRGLVLASLGRHQQAGIALETATTIGESMAALHRDTMRAASLAERLAVDLAPGAARSHRREVSP